MFHSKEPEAGGLLFFKRSRKMDAISGDGRVATGKTQSQISKLIEELTASTDNLEREVSNIGERLAPITSPASSEEPTGVGAEPEQPFNSDLACSLKEIAGKIHCQKARLCRLMDRLEI